jgi:hypothetical protein
MENTAVEKRAAREKPAKYSNAAKEFGRVL